MKGVEQDELDFLTYIFHEIDRKKSGSASKIEIVAYLGGNDRLVDLYDLDRRTLNRHAMLSETKDGERMSLKEFVVFVKGGAKILKRKKTT